MQYEPETFIVDQSVENVPQEAISDQRGGYARAYATYYLHTESARRQRIQATAYPREMAWRKPILSSHPNARSLTPFNAGKSKLAKANGKMVIA